MTRWTTAAEKHGVTRESSAAVIASTVGVETTTNDGYPGLLYIGYDHLGEAVEVITVEIPGDRLVIHAMPYEWRLK